MKHSTNIWRAQFQLHQTPEMSTKNLLFAKKTKPTTHWNSHIGTHHPLTIFILQADCSYSHLMLISPIINNTTDQPNESINPCRFCILYFSHFSSPIILYIPVIQTHTHSSYKWQPSQYQSHTPQKRRNQRIASKAQHDHPTTSHVPIISQTYQLTIMKILMHRSSLRLH